MTQESSTRLRSIDTDDYVYTRPAGIYVTHSIFFMIDADKIQHQDERTGPKKMSLNTLRVVVVIVAVVI